MPSRTHDMDDPSSAADAELENSQAPSSPTHAVGDKSNFKALTLTGPDCAVCTDHAPGGTIYRRHYGVICCEACKCFFRRTVQMNRDYKCRSDGNCYVGRTTENQKQVCQACRFQQCIRAGMKLDSVKRFPRKTRSMDANQEESKGSSPKSMTGKNAKLKGKRARSNGHKDRPLSVKEGRSPFPPDANGVTQGGSPSPDKGAVEEAKILNHGDRKEVSDELQLCDTDLENVKFKLSPSEAMLYLQSASTTVPQLFKYDSIESIHAKSTVQVSSTVTASEEGHLSRSSVGVPVTEQSRRHARTDGIDPKGFGHVREGVVLKVRQSSDDDKAALAKRLCLDGEGLAHMTQYWSSQLPPNGSTPLLTPSTPSHPHSQPPSRHHSPSCSHTQTPSQHHSPDQMIVNNMYPYVTPHGTPTNTPIQSPLSSPTLVSLSHPPNYHLHPASHPNSSQQGGMPFNGERWPPITQPGDFLSSSPSPSVSHFNMSGVPSQLHLQPPPVASPGAIIFNPHHSSSVPFQVLASTSLLPMVLSAHPRHPAHLLGGANRSPFRIIPIPSINRTQPEEMPEEPEVNVCDSPDQGDLKPFPPGSAPSSACASPINKPKKFTHLAEAKLEEVLDSLRLRIRSLFTWAKSEVSGFDDLSPLDQKALLRRTVPELVMLGFARGSIAYNDLLLLGSTGKVIRPTNQNSGVASVASVTLQKLVVPLKVLNIDDRELTMLKEIVLFNPESNGLHNREVVRVYRKDKHLKLMEYTEKSDDPGRFGDLLCLLTPLFEVSTEVTEQLRLEQFVHEGEARIDALLLMSMISGADEMPDEHSLDSQQLL